jgi:methanogen extracellular protein (TIGR04279 family)/PGF-pre-PGF domain-containing protein
LRKSQLILILAILVLTSTPVMASSAPTVACCEETETIANLNFTDKVVYFLDHTSDPAEGNWIVMGCPNEGTRIQLPTPMKLTYNGPKHMEYGGAKGALNKCEEESYTITYPSTRSYTTHPIFLPTEKVEMSFYGEPALENETVDIYLIKLTSGCAHELLDSFLAGDIRNLNTLFEESAGEEYKKYSVKLDECGDISDYNLGLLDAGQYCIVMVQQNQDRSLTVLSSTAFVVTEHKLCISSPSSIVKGKDLDISMSLEGAAGNDCTYAAVLIKEQAYKANIEINSNGTKAGTSVIVNEVDLIEEFDINSSNYRSKLTKNELQTEIQTLIGEGKGAIAIGEVGQDKLSLTAFDLPVGCYYLLVGAYSPEKGLVGLNQTEVEIKPKGSSKSDDKKDKEDFTEPEKNIKKKDSCQQFVSNGKKVKFYFKNAATPVGYIEFYSRKTAGRITAFVEELKGKSSKVTEEPEGEVYKYINIQVGDGKLSSSKNIKDAIVGFKVSKEWIDENHIDTDTIVLQHYTEDQWNPLKTEKTGEDDEYIYFEAETTSFSPFAIVASKNILLIEEKTGGDEDHSISDEKQQGNSEIAMGSDTSPVEDGNSGLKIASFLLGALVIIAIGAIIKKRTAEKSEDENSEKKT